MAIGTFIYIDADGNRRVLTDPVDTIAYNVELWIAAEVINNTDTTAWLHEEEDGDGRSHPVAPGDHLQPDEVVASVVFA
ncbi:hypothetical protein [Nocardia transvalensis]|uniref:hypothetical protein n=1 Tax=Nocardia transvalensis TaxID=37333 RepID=UPI0018938AC5|nr:hypothetical protein [Nocardia transvalensis]MBF6333834.1 hypothetical protein [Nocardia transvalensis]